MSYGSTILDRLDDAFVKIMIEELAQNTTQSQSGLPMESAEDLTSGEAETAVAGLAIPNTQSPSSSDTLGSIPMEPMTDEPISNEPTTPTISEVASVQPAPSKTVRWQLRIVQQDKPECILPLEGKPITIGRGGKSEIVLNCNRVSREHAVIRFDENRPRVDDLGSQNGTLVNGIKVPAALLKQNDEILIGSVRIYVETSE